MTRFARAKGSKSSNERAPEDSTPWEVMKEQLLQAKTQSEEAKKREEAEKQRIENYENFLKEHKTQKRKATWCDFPDAEQTKSKELTVEPLSKKKKNKIKQTLENGNSELTQPYTVTDNVSNVQDKKNKKKQKVKPTKNPEEENALETINDEISEDNVTENSQKKKKLKKKKQKNLNLETSSEATQLKNSDHNEQTRLSNGNVKNKKSKKQNSNLNATKSQESEHKLNSEQNKNQPKKQKKVKKLVDGVPVRRKPINDHSFQLIINGKEVVLVRFDGFPIMKKDAERLEELKSNMIKKGIPKSEVNRTLKLERRRAEKALARLKRDVCYNCRKGGHNLSDCPELKTKIPGVGAPDGVCFKCGSTEHKQFECKVQKDTEFRFATCFICKEPGHIARQCPDNPKGLYPNGGGCKLCGDVTHLRKDCPTTMGKKEETSIKLQTLDSTDNLEGIEQKTNIGPQGSIKKPKKIKF